MASDRLLRLYPAQQILPTAVQSTMCRIALLCMYPKASYMVEHIAAALSWPKAGLHKRACANVLNLATGSTKDDRPQLSCNAKSVMHRLACIAKYATQLPCGPAQSAA